VEHCVLAAESAGALTALAAALARPERIRGLVIVDGLYYRGTPPDKDGFLEGLRSAYTATIDRFIEACIAEPNSDHIKRWGRQILDRAAVEAAVALYLTASGVDLRDELHRITQPTLILHGELDIVAPLDGAQMLASILPRAELIVLGGAGHVPTMTYPLQVAETITSFFARPQRLLATSPQS
jgi:pimeloyl-ACP methyl ester carboxylesterase